MEEPRNSGQISIQELIEHVPFAALLVDSAGRIVASNSTALEMFQYSASDLLGLEIEALVPQRLRAQHAGHRDGFHRHTRIRPMGVGMDLTGLKKDGSEFPVEIGLSSIEMSGELLIMCFVSDISIRKRVEEENKLLVSQLQSALDDVRKLSGLLPICASCKKIRDDAGHWTAIEDYIVDHSETEFSHGICPDCAERLYPQYFGKGN